MDFWDAANEKPEAERLAGHIGWVTAVAVGRFGGRDVIVSGSQDCTVRMWDAATRQPVGDPLVGHTDHVTAVVARPGRRP